MRAVVEEMTIVRSDRGANGNESRKKSLRENGAAVGRTESDRKRLEFVFEAGSLWKNQ